MLFVNRLHFDILNNLQTIDWCSIQLNDEAFYSTINVNDDFILVLTHTHVCFEVTAARGTKP